MKQHNIPWIGAVTDTIFNSLPLLSVYTYVSLTIILYTNVKPYLLEWGYDWVTWWLFFGMISIAVAVLFIIVYKFVLLPLWGFRARQMFGMRRSEMSLDEFVALCDRMGMEITVSPKESHEGPDDNNASIE